MDKDLWCAANELFHAVLELPHDERSSFLQTTAAKDPALLAEVEALLSADGLAGDYLESPVFPDGGLHEAPLLRKGDVLCSRFEVVRFVAKGGMGQVFEAYDRELSVHIALKVIRPEIAGKPEALARFRQEVRLARQITHRNVARTYDINRETRDSEGPSGFIVFLTMEFLEGETLADLIAHHGPLDCPKALHISRQVAEGLEAAHALGIVHRDIKPANIILVPEPGFPPSHVRAVVTDFGLAKFKPTLSTDGDLSPASTTTGVTGTLAYMAPEQLAGTAVSPATDVYAFGLVLFEMLSGKRAFPEDGLFESIEDRINGLPPSLTEHAPQLPAAWHQAVDASLRRDRAERLQHPQEIIAIIEDALRPRYSFKRFPPAWRWGAVSGFLLLTLALILTVSRLAKYRVPSNAVPSALPAGALVYLGPTQNRTGDRSLDNIGELLEASLDQSAHLRLLDPVHAESVLRQMGRSDTTKQSEDVLREVALRSGAVRVLFTSVTREHASTTLHLDLQQPDHNPSTVRQHWTNDFSWPSTSSEGAQKKDRVPQTALDALRSAEDWVRHAVGESANDIAQLDKPAEDATTANWQALNDYSRARKLLASNLPDHKEQAIALLQDAVRLDPGFARAWAELGDNLVSLDRRQDGYSAYLTALTADGGRRLSRKESDFIKGSFATDTRDYQTAADSFRDLSAFYPDDFEGWFYQAFPLDMLDRAENARKALTQATLIEGVHNIPAEEWSFNQMLTGDYQGAERSISLMRDSDRVEEANEQSGVLAFLDGQYGKAESFFVGNQNSDTYTVRINGYLLQVRLLAEQGRYLEARSVASAGLDALGSLANRNDRGILFLDRATVEQALGNDRSSLTDLDQALRWNTTADAALMACSVLGRMLPHAAGPERRHALDILHALDHSIPADTVLLNKLARARIRGELLLAQGQPHEALREFYTADRLDAPLAPRDYLARGLLAVAAVTSDPVQAQSRRMEALNNYRRTALRPVVVWMIAWQYPPGEVANEMSSYLALAGSRGYTDDETVHVAEALKRMQNKTRTPPALLNSSGVSNLSRPLH